MCSNTTAILCISWHAENQTFTASEQDVATHNGAQLNGNACSLTSDPVHPCPAPTEHRLSWSHATHPPSVASSTLLDPEGRVLLRVAIVSIASVMHPARDTIKQQLKLQVKPLQSITTRCSVARQVMDHNTAATSN